MTLRRLVLLLVVTTLAGAWPASASAAKKPRCGQQAGKTLEASGAARAYVRRGVVYACALGARKRHRLGENAGTECGSSSGCGGIDEIRVEGTWVAFSDFGCCGSFGDSYFTLSVLDLRQGELTLRVPHGQEGVEDATLKSLVLRGRTGSVAWGWERQVKGAAQPVGEISEAGSCSPRTLDSGVAVEVASLTLRGDTLSWRRAGERPSVTLCG